MTESSNDHPTADRDVLGVHTRVTKRRPKEGFMLEITWRGLVLVWDGRRGRWEGEAHGNKWYLTLVSYEMFAFLKPGQDASDVPREQLERQFGSARWLAWCGNGGDGAQRDSVEEALEASLEYALRYNHRRIHELRVFSGEA